MSILILILTLVYIVVLSAIYFSYKKRSLAREKITESISVILPFRNEEQSIIRALNSIVNQKFKGDFEIVLVNDHSTDNSVVLVEAFLQEMNGSVDIKLYHLENGKQGKKQGNILGIENSKYPLISIFDADCIADPHWLQAVSTSFYNDEIVASLGEVIIKNKNTFLSVIQHSESILTSVFTIAGIKSKRPLLVSAANFSFKRDVFGKLGGYSGNEHISSGDDIFLFQKIINQFGPRSFSVVSTAVYTDDVITYRHFFNQRLRWLTKMKYAKSLYFTNLLSSFIALYNTLLFVGVLFIPHIILPFIPVKYIVDLFLLSSNKHTSTKAIIYSPLLLVWWLVYPLLLVALKPFIRLHWKQRQVKV